MDMGVFDRFEWYHKGEHGRIFHGDSYHLISNLRASSVDLLVTSPPFGLVREKEYGNVQADEYIDWFRPFAKQMHRVLKDTGSLVIDIGGAWNKGLPTRHLYHFELLIMLCREFNFHLAQDFYWWNPAKLPTPAEWVTVRRIRVKDAINKVWWLSKTPWPKASNRRVLQPYSDGMKDLLANGYQPKMRPSGHDISDKFGNDNGAAIPPNLIAVANTESNSSYLRFCRSKGIKPHPARFPVELPEFFVRMLTDENDLVIDPFAGSCVTGEICERLKRRWICAELRRDYVEGAVGRFATDEFPSNAHSRNADSVTYKIARPGANWTDETGDKLGTGEGLKRKSDAPPKRPVGRPRKPQP